MSDSLNFVHIQKGTMDFLNQNGNSPLQTSPTIERVSSTSNSGNSGKFIGASLLCFSVDPQYNRVYFLLGQEKKTFRWPQGSERFSDFGGACQNSSESPEHAAAREFAEETLGMVKYFESDTIPRTEFYDIVSSLFRKEYIFKIIIGYNKKNYVVFLKQIPWDPECTYRFDACRGMLMNPNVFVGTPKWEQLLSKSRAFRQITDLLGNTHLIVNKNYVEKKKLAYFSIPQLQFAVENNGILAKKNGIIDRCRGSFVQIIELVLCELTFVDPNNYNSDD